MADFVASLGARDVIIPGGNRKPFPHLRPDVVERDGGSRTRRTDGNRAARLWLAGESWLTSFCGECYRYCHLR